MVRTRFRKVNGFRVRLGPRKPRRVRDYKDRKEKPFKTKTGQIWSDNRYFKTGAYRGKVHGKKSGFVKY